MLSIIMRAGVMEHNITKVYAMYKRRLEHSLSTYRLKSEKDRKS